MSFNVEKPEPGLYRGIQNELYHRGPGVSRTALMKLDGGSPAACKRYLDGDGEQTAAMARGSAVDCAVFTPHDFDRLFVMKPRMGKEKAEQWEREQRDAGRTVMTPAPFQRALAMADAVRRSSVRGMLAQATSQASIYWTDKDTGLLCKARPDAYDEATGEVYDLKTCSDLEDRKLATGIVDFGAHVQAAMIRNGLQELGLPWKSHTLIYVSDKEPHEVRPLELSESWLEYGEVVWQRLLREFKGYAEADSWPRYDSDIPVFPMPKWAHRNLEAELENAQ